MDRNKFFQRVIEYIDNSLGTNKESFICVNATNLPSGAEYHIAIVLDDATVTTLTDTALHPSSAAYPSSLPAGVTLFGNFTACVITAGAIKFYKRK